MSFWEVVTNPRKCQRRDAGKPPLGDMAWPNMENKDTTCFIVSFLSHVFYLS